MGIRPLATISSLLPLGFLSIREKTTANEKQLISECDGKAEQLILRGNGENGALLSLKLDGAEGHVSSLT